MEDILTREKIRNSIDETMFNVKKSVLQAMSEALEDKEFAAFTEEATSLELILAIKYSLLEVCAVEIYMCVHPDTPYRGEYLRELSMEYIYRIHRKLHTA